MKITPRPPKQKEEVNTDESNFNTKFVTKDQHAQQMKAKEPKGRA